MDGRQKLAKFPPRENLRQRIQKFCPRTVPRVRLGEFPHIHLALPRRQRIGAHFAKHQGLDRINAHDKCFTLRRSTTSRKEKLISARSEERRVGKELRAAWMAVRSWRSSRPARICGSESRNFVRELFHASGLANSRTFTLLFRDASG